MAQDWQVGHSTGRCSVTNRELTEGEEFYAVLFEDGESFRRADYSVESWTGPPEGSYCHFKTRVPVKEKKKRLLVDDELLMNFFLRLDGDEDPARVRFRFVLALILMRKRLLRYDATQTADGLETWTMTTPKDHATHRIINPHLTDEQIEGVSEQVTLILHGDMGSWSPINDDSDEVPTENSHLNEPAVAQGEPQHHAGDPSEAVTPCEPVNGNQ